VKDPLYNEIDRMTPSGEELSRKVDSIILDIVREESINHILPEIESVLHRSIFYAVVRVLGERKGR
jgi:hypothetical protein